MSLARELVEQHELLDIAAGLDASSEIGLKLHNISDFVPDLIIRMVPLVPSKFYAEILIAQMCQGKHEFQKSTYSGCLRLVTSNILSWLAL